MKAHPHNQNTRKSDPEVCPVILHRHCLEEVQAMLKPNPYECPNHYLYI